MSNEEMRIAVAGARGWRWNNETIYSPSGSRSARFAFADGSRGDLIREVVPNYPEDLNACHEMESVLTDDQKDKYTTVLHEVVGNSPFWWAIAHATAAQRCEAFLRTKGLWK